MVALVAHCSPEPTASISAPVVYGTDDRHDVYDHPNAALRMLADQSIVAQMPAAALDMTDPSNVQLVSDTLGTTQNLCTTERFRDDPTAAECSGTLIDDDLVLTAGHCFDNEAACQAARFVFHYYRDAVGHLHTITSADVFQCRSLLVRQLGMVGSQDLDYAVFRLDRPATPRFTPAAVRRGMTPRMVNDPLAIIGFGSGVPAKIDTGGVVRDPRADTLDYFLGTTDSFQGNSGSGIFDPTTLDLIGILVRGDTDYVPNGSCNVVHQCAPDACSGESITYPHNAINALCAATTSTRLCGSAPADGGVVADAGTVDHDSGSGPADAGTTPGDDGGSTPQDAGANPATDAGSGTTMHSGCSVPGPVGHARASLGLAIVALGSALGRRARRRVR